MHPVIKRNNVNIKGSGPALLFAHGFVGDQTLWRHVANKFATTHKVILFDYVGSGRSEASAYDSQKYATLEGYAQDVCEICEALELNDIVFVGHSISAMIGLVAALDSPKYFSRMVFVAPSPRYINDIAYKGGFDKPEIMKMIETIESDYQAWARNISPLVMNQPATPELSEELIQKLLSSDQKRILNFAKATFFADYRAALLRFKIPTLTLQCLDDVMAPLEVGNYLNAHLENNILKVLNVKGHFPQLSAPLEVVQAIKEFLQKKRSFKRKE